MNNQQEEHRTQARLAETAVSIEKEMEQVRDIDAFVAHFKDKKIPFTFRNILIWILSQMEDQIRGFSPLMRLQSVLTMLAHHITKRLLGDLHKARTTFGFGDWIAYLQQSTSHIVMVSTNYWVAAMTAAEIKSCCRAWADQFLVGLNAKFREDFDKLVDSQQDPALGLSMYEGPDKPKLDNQQPTA